jgi:hypothetical protein
MSEELTGWKMRSGLMARVHMNSNVRKINKNSKASLPQTIWVGEISVQIEPDTRLRSSLTQSGLDIRLDGA